MARTVAGLYHSSDPREHSRPNFNYNGAYVTSKRNLLLVLLAALILGGAVFLVVRRRPPRAVAVGELAPRFELPSLAEGPARLRDFHGQVVVLNFWATWCQPCVEETPSLEKFAEKMRPDGVAVIGVSVDQDQAALERFVLAQRLSFPIARDPEQVLSGRYGTFIFPETYILDRSGRVAEKIIGPIDWQDPRIIEFVRGLARPNERAAR